MTLIFFHRFLIACAILFSIGFAVNQYRYYDRTQDGSALIMTVCCSVAAVALLLYLRTVKTPHRPQS